MKENPQDGIPRFLLPGQLDEAAASAALPPALPTHGGPSPAVQDTDSRGGGNGQDGASGN